MANESAGRPGRKILKESTSGAFGAGLVLIVLPCAALYFGIDKIGAHPIVGLPILAVFGIMILFGALALISTLFARLYLSDASQALALPEGSIRAAIALALIVLFAIISIMLYQSISKPYEITGLAEAQKDALLKDVTNHVIAVVPQCRASVEGTAAALKGAGATPTPVTSAEGAATLVKGAEGPTTPLKGCDPQDVRYSVFVRQPQGQESTDLAKQLLILIGTLMTSVTSFYFASRATEPKREDKTSGSAGDGTAGGDGQGGTGSSGQSAGENTVDGCDVAVVNATQDEDLPASKGGVASNG